MYGYFMVSIITYIEIITLQIFCFSFYAFFCFPFPLKCVQSEWLATKHFVSTKRVNC